MSFTIQMPAEIRFGRGIAAAALADCALLRGRVLLVHGRDGARADWARQALEGQGADVTGLACPGEPDLPFIEAALADMAAAPPQAVLAVGGGAAIDAGKALAALIPQPGAVLDHLEVVGKGLPLTAAPLPFVAVPTTAGTGAEATKNAVIGVPEAGRKVSLRDPAMLPRLAIVDPALTDNAPRGVTLASGLDAVTQVIEPYLSAKATPYTDALTRPAIPQGLRALAALMAGEDEGARDALAHVSLTGGIALANSGLGAVHGLAGVIGGLTGAPHGAICGALLAPVLRANGAALPEGHPVASRLAWVRAEIAAVLGGTPEAAPDRLAAWAREAGLPGLGQMGLAEGQLRQVAESAAASSSMKGNPVPLPPEALEQAMREAM